MIGDAAYCVTPIAGKGTDLAVSGAYIIAGELSRTANHEKAFEAYESLMRPYVKKVQKVPPGVPRLVYPTSKFGIAVLYAFFSVAGSKPAKFFLKLFGKRKVQLKKEIYLPDYNV